MNTIVLIDAGTGNLRSVQKALENVGAHVLRTDDPKKVLRAGKVVLPGVGAFGEFMSGLYKRRLLDTLKELARREIALLGICVGMQALFEESDEMGQHAGLGLLGGRVVRLEESLPVKIPHTGWNQIEIDREAALFRGIHSGAYVYFNHSFYCQPRNIDDISATTQHGLTYACAVQRDNLMGVQFHPEKSQAVGLQILKNFLEI
jgi:glutamine amidotransferase